MRATSTPALSNTDPALRRCWHPIALVDEIAAGPVLARLLGETWAVVRVSDPLTGPSLTALRRSDGAAPAALVEHDGLVFLAPEEPVTDLLDLFGIGGGTGIGDGDGFDVGWLDPVRARVGAGLMTDNFLDMAHFPFVHGATIGTAESARVGDMTITREGLGMTVVSQHPFQHHEDPGVAAGVRPLVQQRRLTYTYRAPFAVNLRIEYLDAGGSNMIAFYVQPESDESCRLYAAVYRDDLDGNRAAMHAAVRYETAIVQEDLDLQTRYRDLRLPLDLRTEVHIKADAATIELRRILADLVATTA
jgi:phenylpropionate dioxygenase-like ring-hydroxylating dioxygenase large terminal subunit